MPHVGYSRTKVSMENDSSNESFAGEEVIAINSISFILRSALEEYVLVNDENLSDKEVFVLMRFHEELTNETLLSDESYNEQINNELDEKYSYTDSAEYWNILMEGLKLLSVKTEEEYSSAIHDSLLDDFRLYRFSDKKFFLDELSSENDKDALFGVTKIVGEEMKREEFNLMRKQSISFPNKYIVKQTRK